MAATQASEYGYAMPPKWRYFVRGRRSPFLRIRNVDSTTANIRLARTIKIFGPPRRAVSWDAHAPTRVCLDGVTCHHIDTKHIYLGVEDRDENKDVLLWTFAHLDPSKTYVVSMELLHGMDGKLAISHLEYSHEVATSWLTFTFLDTVTFFMLFTVVVLILRR